MVISIDDAEAQCLAVSRHRQAPPVGVLPGGDTPWPCGLPAW